MVGEDVSGSDRNVFRKRQEPHDPQPVRQRPLQKHSVPKVALKPGRVRVDRHPILVAERDAVEKVRQLVDAARPAPDRLDQKHAVLIDNRVFTVLLLNPHSRRQHADNRHQGKGDDRQAERDFDHGEPGIGAPCVP